VVRATTAVGGLLGGLLLVAGTGIWALVGLTVLSLAVVVGFMDGYTGWSDR
jgi:hypothetical protein